MIYSDIHEEQRAFVRSCLTSKRFNLRGVALINHWFGCGGTAQTMRRSRVWTSRRLAVDMSVPLAQANDALRAAGEAGMMRLGDGGWRWAR